MIAYQLPHTISLDTRISSERTLKDAFEVIINWDMGYVKERLVDGDTIPDNEIDEAILEWRKYFMCVVVARALKVGSVAMMSKKIDEVWHNMILFTREYFLLSEKILGSGSYLHHAPVIKSHPSGSSSKNVFSEVYQQLFGQIPSIWGVKYANGLVWEDGAQGICLVDQFADCDEVCKSSAPCSCDGGGSLPD